MWQNFWQLRVNDRLTQWKDFRRKISDLPIEEAITEINEMWSTAPFVTYHLSPDEPNTWPDPWLLLAENYYCDLAKALGIMYTIYFSSHKNIESEIRIYYDYETKERHNISWIDKGKYILNYWPYEIVNTKELDKKNLQLLHKYTTKDLDLNKY